MRSLRSVLLKKAEEIITKERNNSYGEPHQDFKRTAALWSIILNAKVGPADVAKCMIALKLSRLTWDDKNYDSWLDIAGYAACGYEARIIDGINSVEEGRRKILEDK